MADAPSPHGLNSAHHDGTLDDSQAPQFLKTDGSRDLTGNLAVSSGVTVDGVDISVLHNNYQTHLGDPTSHNYIRNLLDDSDVAAPKLTGNDVKIYGDGTDITVTKTVSGLLIQFIGAGAGGAGTFSGIKDPAGTGVVPDGLAWILTTDDGVINVDASGANTLAFTVNQASISHGNLGGVTANQHHNQSHVLGTATALGPDHTVSGLTAGQVLRATSATAAKFMQLALSDLSGAAIGTDLQAWDANLDQIAALTPTDSNIIVGNGSAWVAESGATARTSLGVGTGDSPQFTAVNLGHATDTTIARVSAGLISVDGDTVTLNTATQTLTNKTLTTPTIASFVNATHTHQDTAGAGQLDHGAALTGLTDDDHTQYLLATGARTGATSSSQTFTTGVIDSSLTASRLMYSDGSKKLVSVSTLSSWIAGTTNQVTVADDGDGSATLSLPQNIHTAATPTFARMTLSQATGTAPLTISSTTVVTNLHADHVNKTITAGNGLTGGGALTSGSVATVGIFDRT